MLNQLAVRPRIALKTKEKGRHVSPARTTKANHAYRAALMERIGDMVDHGGTRRCACERPGDFGRHAGAQRQINKRRGEARTLLRAMLWDVFVA